MRPRSTVSMRIAAGALICLAGAAVAGFAPAQPRAAQTPTAAPAVEKAAPPSVCTGCHGLAVLAHMRQGEEGWRAIVDYMALHGAYMTPAEHEAAVAWLVRNYGPAAPPQPTSDAGPQPRDLDLVRTDCTSCHGLARVTERARSPAEWGEVVAQMRAMGAQVSDSEAVQIVRYLSGSH